MNGFDVDWTKQRRKPNFVDLPGDYFDALEWRWHRKYPNQPRLVRAKWDQAVALVNNEDRDNWHKKGYADHYMRLYVDGLISKEQLRQRQKVLDSRDQPSISYAWSIARHFRPRENRTYGPA